LVVDDDEAMRDAVTRMLHRAGYDVLPANGAHHALEIIKANPPVHVVVSDIQMPEMLGTQLIREVTQLSPQTAGVLMTAAIINPADLPDGLIVLKKPFRMQDLISVVEAILAGRSNAEREPVA
jgi:two-component system cell cycle sensor histidine kinase/response regulator CckA